jgi:hypothetical protein
MPATHNTAAAAFDFVSLQGRIHLPHATRTIRRMTDGRTVPVPACGQRSGRFYPDAIRAADLGIEVTCKKCQGL